MALSLRSAAAIAALAVSAVCAAPQSSYGGGSGNLPIVDLGYERHQAYSYNATGEFYNFTNIRYAAPRTLTMFSRCWRSRLLTAVQLLARTASGRRSRRRGIEARCRRARRAGFVRRPIRRGCW